MTDILSDLWGFRPTSPIILTIQGQDIIQYLLSASLTTKKVVNKDEGKNEKRIEKEIKKFVRNLVNNGDKPRANYNDIHRAL